MEVIALVGPAGTGKSHRASLVAHEVGADAIVDDGLLIHGSRIVAGRSAKAEATRLAAVRRAIFTEPDHREEVREAIRRLGPQRLLVLGTSEDMVRRICDALELPAPSRSVSIYDVASPDEIRRARRIRRRLGKHVIPAPTLEVKRRLSGLLVDRLRLFYRSKQARGGMVIEKSVVRPTFSSLGRFYIADTVVGAIAEYAAAREPGIEAVLRARVESGPEGVEVSLEVSVWSGVPIVPVCRGAQRRAREAVEFMTALQVRSVDVIARRVAVPSGDSAAGGPVPAADAT